MLLLVFRRTLLCFVGLKTWLRFETGEERLTDSVLLDVHRDIDVNVRVITDRFACGRKKRINITLKL